jgi:hypothetical protein
VPTTSQFLQSGPVTWHRYDVHFQVDTDFNVCCFYHPVPTLKRNDHRKFAVRAPRRIEFDELRAVVGTVNKVGSQRSLMLWTAYTNNDAWILNGEMRRSGIFLIPETTTGRGTGIHSTVTTLLPSESCQCTVMACITATCSR